jgi:thioredoxin-related protein
MKRMQNYFGLILLGLMISLQSFTLQGDSPIKYSDASWGTVTKQAAQQNKIIFVYVSMKGCHTCHDLEKTLDDATVTEFYNANFINVHLDGGKTANNLRASKWGVAQVPALVFLDSKGKVLHKLEGFQSPDDMIAQAKIALEQKTTK